MIRLSGVLFLSCLVVIPVFSKTAAAEDSDSGLVVCLPAYVDSFDPTNHRSRITQLVLSNMFESLTTRNHLAQVVPALAESWRAVTPTVWEFKLKKGVHFHNGDELKARDVKFTLDRVIGENGPDGWVSPRKQLFESISRVVTMDDYTVRIVTRRPWAILPTMLTLQEIIPKSYFESVGGPGFERNPMGSGPFLFESARDGKNIVLARFPGHRDYEAMVESERNELVGRLVFDVVPAKIDQMARLKKGEADLIFNVPPSALAILERTPGIKIIGHRATRSHFADINCTKPSFKDIRVRQAFNYAMDMQAVVDNILLGQGEVLSTVLQHRAFGYDPNLASYPYDPQKAETLLKSAAYPWGRPVRVFCNDQDREFGSIIVLFLTKVGLSASLHVTDYYRPKTRGPAAEWDIFVGSWGNITLDPVGIMAPKFKSNVRGNFSGYQNPGVDRLMQEAEETVDSEARAVAYREIQAIIYKDAPMIFGYAADEIYGLRDRVKNFLPTASGLLQFKFVGLESGS